MKFTTIHLENNKIELFNSVFGKETIKVNNEIVSEKRSILGTEHLFQIKENENEANCRLVTGFGRNGVVFDLYKNDKPIIESPKNGAMGVIMIIGFAIIIIAVLDKVLS
ncbi:hypothetical protein ACXR6G_18105 [Ancylomarina sp. YFZ004]